MTADAFGIDDDDIVAEIEVRAVGNLVLAFENLGDGGRETAQGLSLSVYNEPLAGNVLLADDVGFHLMFLQTRLAPTLEVLAGH